MSNVPVEAPTELTAAEQQQHVRASMAMVQRVADREAGKRKGLVTVEDLISVGNEALVQAARRFDPSLGVPFEGYAHVVVCGAIQNAVIGEAKRRRRTLHVAAFEVLETLQERGNPVNRSDEDTHDQLRAMADAVVAGMAEGLVSEASRRGRAGEEAVLEERERVHAERCLAEARSKLATRDQEVLDLHYRDRLDWKTIAARMGVSYATIRRHHEHALARLGAAVATMSSELR